jgi:hypothetical protein
MTSDYDVFCILEAQSFRDEGSQGQGRGQGQGSGLRPGVGRKGLGKPG